MPTNLLAFAVAALLFDREMPVCDQPGYRAFRSGDETNLVVRALDSTMVASDALPPFVYADWQPPGKRPTIAGQVVLVEQLLGIRPNGLGPSGFRAVLVPWAHDPGCEPISWTENPRWMAPGTVGFVAARLRPRDKWAGKLPTFDVRDAWREPYTIERAQIFTRGAAEQREVMSPAEYGQFYLAFPLIEVWRRNPDEALRPLKAWQRANPSLAAKEPAHTLLQTMLRAAEVK